MGCCNDWLLIFLVIILFTQCGCGCGCNNNNGASFLNNGGCGC